MLNIPRVVIAGTHSGVGKTTIATGLMAALRAQGLKVQGFKVGPDYIDPSYHTRATGRPSRNLDTWLVGEDGVRELFQRSAADCDIAVIEGVMGMFDGFGGTSELGSTAHVAKLLKAPVVLVVNAKSMSRSIAAMVKGYSELDPEAQVKGVLLNRVSSPRHGELLREAINQYNHLPVVGELKADAVLPWPERHLGLVPMAEQSSSDRIFSDLAGIIADSVNLQAVLEIARSAAVLTPAQTRIFSQESGSARKGAQTLKIGYARDEAFNFYYQDALDLLTHYGAELVPVSPLHDQGLPEDLSGLFIGGGFPELYLEGLGANLSFISQLRNLHTRGLPIYCECGGLMYLTEQIVGFDGAQFPMAGLIPGTCRMQRKLAALGYYQGSTQLPTILGPSQTPVRGHEFHYSTLEDLPEDFPWVYQLNKGGASPLRKEGYAQDNLLAGYLHMHFAGNPELARGFVESCRAFKERG
ncbi:MAG TPA: cobyrinate a,c-diamide synthase [Bacillota bacterium]|nr:cobyrinate a,c-diamide synthase [Bacillota bacterium]